MGERSALGQPLLSFLFGGFSVAGNFITSDIDSLFRDSMLKLVDDLGTKSTFDLVLPAPFVPCPNCIYDPTAKASSGTYNGTGAKPFTGKQCPVCRGKGSVGVSKTRRLPSVIVTWSKLAPSSENIPTPPGELPYGYARCKTRVDFLPLISKAIAFIVDGHRCRIVGVPKRRGLKTFVIVEVLVKRDD